MTEQPNSSKHLSKKQAFLLYVLKSYNIKVNLDNILNISDEYDEETIHKECIGYFKNKTNKTKTQIVNIYDNPIYSIISRCSTQIHIL